MMKLMNIFLLGTVIFLQGCAEVKKTLGIERNVPEEFDVVENAPLIVPPHVNLPLPLDKSSLPLNEATPQEAEAALLGNTSIVNKRADLNTQTQENVSQIKKIIDQEATTEIKEDNRPEWIQKLFFWQKKKVGTVLNPEEEVEKLKNPVAFSPDNAGEEIQLNPDSGNQSDVVPEAAENFLEKAGLQLPEIAPVTVCSATMENDSSASLPVSSVAVTSSEEVISPVPVVPVPVVPAVPMPVVSSAPLAPQSAQVLYGGTINKPAVVIDPTIVTKIERVPLLLTKALPSKAIIKKYIDTPVLIKKKKNVVPPSVPLPLETVNVPLSPEEAMEEKDKAVEQSSSSSDHDLNTESSTDQNSENQLPIDQNMINKGASDLSTVQVPVEVSLNTQKEGEVAPLSLPVTATPMVMAQETGENPEQFVSVPVEETQGLRSDQSSVGADPSLVSASSSSSLTTDQSQQTLPLKAIQSEGDKK